MKKGIRQIRLCRFCGNQVKEKWSDGIFKGYYRTCGSCDFRIGKNNPFYGKKHSKKTLRKIPLFKKGRIPWNKGKKGLQKNPFLGKLNKSRKGIPRTDKVKKKISKTKAGKPNPAVQGSKNRHWKGGINPINNTIRNSREYKIWRLAVFMRDNYICMICSAKSGKGKAVYFEAHHIKSFADYPELRFVIDNGITFCKKCHKLTRIKK